MQAQQDVPESLRLLDGEGGEGYRYYFLHFSTDQQDQLTHTRNKIAKINIFANYGYHLDELNDRVILSKIRVPANFPRIKSIFKCFKRY